MDFKTDNLGVYLKHKRKSKKLTMDSVATTLGISIGYISRIENGSSKPSRKVLSKLCNLYESDILDVEDKGQFKLKNRDSSTDISSLIFLDGITFDGEPISTLDKININNMIKILLGSKNSEDKDDLMSIINTIGKIKDKN